jgi:hypothetical protein
VVYIYVEEDSTMAELSWWPRWFEGHPVFSVYEVDVDPDGRVAVELGQLPLCSGLIRNKAIWFYSFPETRSVILDGWKYMLEHGTFKVPYRINKQLGKLVAAARRDHRPEQMPEPLFLRSELERPLQEEPAPSRSEMYLPSPPESLKEATSIDGAEHALWETETSERGFQIVSWTKENQVRARDYLIDRLEGAGIQVRGVTFSAQFQSYSEEHIPVEFRGEAATIAAPLFLEEPLRLWFVMEWTDPPDPEQLVVKLYFGPRSAGLDDPGGPHLHSVIGSVRDVVALLQS